MIRNAVVTALVFSVASLAHPQLLAPAATLSPLEYEPIPLFPIASQTGLPPVPSIKLVSPNEIAPQDQCYPPTPAEPLPPDPNNLKPPSTEPVCHHPVAEGEEMPYYTSREACEAAVTKVCDDAAVIPADQYCKGKPLTARPQNCLATLYVSELAEVPTRDVCIAKFVSLLDRCVNATVAPAPSNLGAINAGQVVVRDYFYDSTFLGNMSEPMYGVTATSVLDVW
ncbi:MAG: hypothetical protein M1833_005226 [Piccolia ochrophora]|nr:MAG: hypothetical protein M1833_005226 [Piccolia ochrophora]